MNVREFGEAVVDADINAGATASVVARDIHGKHFSIKSVDLHYDEDMPMIVVVEIEEM